MTTTPGYDRPLYILPFDHRGTFLTKMLGAKGPPTAEQAAAIAAMKQVIYDGFRAALAGGVPRDRAGILVDEQFGADVLRDATAQGYTTALTVEKSGQDEFDFEYGEDFAAHIEAFRPHLRQGPGALQPRGRPRPERAARRPASSSCPTTSTRSGRLFMFELLVPAAPGAARPGPRRQAGVRPGGPARPDGAVDPRLQEAGVEPDVWKIEGLDRREDCERVAARGAPGRPRRVGCIVLGRGEDDRKVARVAGDGGRRAGVHRVRGRADDLLGRPDRLARRAVHPGGGRRRDRPPLPGVGRYLRGGRRCATQAGGPRPASPCDGGAAPSVWSKR